MLSSATFRFLSDLKKNNERAWFLANKDRYQAAKSEFHRAVEELILRIAAFDPSVKGLEAGPCIFRINRDIRFSKDKSPYKTHFGAHIGAFDKVSHAHAGYYLHLQPGNCFLGGGAYHPTPEWLKAIRGAIDRDGGELKRILASAAFRKYFGKMEGEALKAAPQGYRPDHLYIEFLKHKSFLAMHRLKDKEMQAPGFAAHAEKVFRALQPFARFFNEASEPD